MRYKGNMERRVRYFLKQNGYGLHKLRSDKGYEIVFSDNSVKYCGDLLKVIDFIEIIEEKNAEYRAELRERRKQYA